MFGVDKSGKDMIWTIGLGRIGFIRCEGENDKAKGSAENLILNYDVYEDLINFLDKVSNKENHEYNLEEIRDRANYIAHFITHRLFLLLKKIDYIFDNYSALNKVFEELNFDSHRFGSELRRSISVVSKHKKKFFEKKGIVNDIYRFSSDGNFDKDLFLRMRWFVTPIRAFHCRICELSEDLRDICKAESVQERPKLLKVVYDLYCKMECFLKEEEKLDKAECDKVNKLTAGVETDILVQDTAQAMGKIAELDKSRLSQSAKELLKINCDSLQKALGIGEVKKTAESDVNLANILQELSCLRIEVEQLKSQKESKGKTQGEFRGSSASQTMDGVIEVDQNEL